MLGNAGLKAATGTNPHDRVLLHTLARHEKDAALTLAWRNVIGAGFALPRDAGRKGSTGRTARRSLAASTIQTVGVPARLHFRSNWPGSRPEGVRNRAASVRVKRGMSRDTNFCARGRHQLLRTDGAPGDGGFGCFRRGGFWEERRFGSGCGQAEGAERPERGRTPSRNERSGGEACDHPRGARDPRRPMHPSHPFPWVGRSSAAGTRRRSPSSFSR